MNRFYETASTIVMQYMDSKSIIIFYNLCELKEKNETLNHDIILDKSVLILCNRASFKSDNMFCLLTCLMDFATFYGR